MPLDEVAIKRTGSRSGSQMNLTSEEKAAIAADGRAATQADALAAPAELVVTPSVDAPKAAAPEPVPLTEKDRAIAELRALIESTLQPQLAAFMQSVQAQLGSQEEEMNKMIIDLKTNQASLNAVEGGGKAGAKAVPAQAGKKKGGK